MNTQKGLLSIESKNIFSILKKWLYTEQDIVFRELISNASDAIEKLKALETKGKKLNKYSEGEIHITLDTNENRLIISDNGIGMTKEEVEKYINQIAFSGATDFINKHTDGKTDSIIGHFGVGFYSAFMIADHVAIETKSYKENTLPVRWDCQSNMSFEIKPGSRTKHGTDVILYLHKDNLYTKKPSLALDIIKKYFIFLRTKIYFNAPGYNQILVNIPDPIWRQPESKIELKEMNEFYREYYNDVSDPLFWIKFESIDIGIRGILFFRDTRNGTEELDGSFRIYSRGVYVGENIKKLIPKFVNLQSGIIDCDNLPLIVSRSTIQKKKQQDDMVNLIYETLSQEVTIAMNNMFENHREKYEKFWPHLNAFVKYGILQDKTFASVMTQKVIFKNIYGKYQTIKEYIEDEADNHNKTVYYASDSIEQAYYIEIFKKCHMNALLLDHVIDQPYIHRQELVHPDIKFVRIDSNIESLFQGSITDEDIPKIEILTKKIHNAIGNRLNKMEVKITNLNQKHISTLIINDEYSRRMADMLEIYGIIKGTDIAAKTIQSKSTFLVNLNNNIVQFILNIQDKKQSDIIINHLFDLALISQGTMELEDIEPFISRSEDILCKLIQN